MAEQGATIQAIASAVGTNKRHVSRYIRTHGIQRPDWRQPPQNAHPMARQTRGPQNPQWRGGRTTDKAGYVLLWMPDHPEARGRGYVREHRIVMEKVLGRPLARREVIHHRNGDTQDNRPENLEVFPDNGQHLRATMTGVPCPARGRGGIAKRRRRVERGLLLQEMTVRSLYALDTIALAPF